MGLTRGDKADSVSAFSLLWNTHVTWDPAENYCFTTFGERRIVLYKSLDKVWFNLEAASCLKTWRDIGKDYNFSLSGELRLLRAEHTAEPRRCLQCSGVEYFIAVNHSRIYSETSFRSISIDAIVITAAATQFIKTLLENSGRVIFLSEQWSLSSTTGRFSSHGGVAMMVVCVMIYFLLMPSAWKSGDIRMSSGGIWLGLVWKAAKFGVKDDIVCMVLVVGD